MTQAVDALVIGAGISGLTAAYSLQAAGLNVMVLEAAPRPGGLVSSHREAGYLMEQGPHTVPSTAADLLELAEKLGLTPQPTNPNAQKRYLYLHGQLTVLPHSPVQALTTPVLSLGGKWRMLQEPFQPSIQADDVSIAEFVRHRLGEEVARNLVDPFVSGIYAGDIEALSLPAVFPRLWRWEQESGSLWRGAVAAQKAARQAGKPRQKMALLSFEGGLECLPQALAAALPPGGLRLNQAVVGITRHEMGYGVRLASGEELITPRLILAVPAHVAAGLLKDVSPPAGRVLAEIPYGSLAVVHTAFAKSAIPHPLDGFGFLIPRREKLALLGSIWAGSLFPSRAPSDVALLANFIGGAHRPDIAQWDPDRIEAQVLSDLQTVFGAAVPLRPLYSKVTAYTRAIPQYTLGHLERIRHIDQALADCPGLSLCGNYRYGVALNECVKSGQQAAQAVLAQVPVPARV